MTLQVYLLILRYTASFYIMKILLKCFASIVKIVVSLSDWLRWVKIEILHLGLYSLIFIHSKFKSIIWVRYFTKSKLEANILVQICTKSNIGAHIWTKSNLKSNSLKLAAAGEKFETIPDKGCNCEWAPLHQARALEIPHPASACSRMAYSI